MIEKNKTYSYDELKEIYKKAEMETIKKLDSEMDKKQKENGKNCRKYCCSMHKMIFVLLFQAVWTPACF
jgi:hypothetical protein